MRYKKNKHLLVLFCFSRVGSLPST